MLVHLELIDVSSAVRNHDSTRSVPGLSKPARLGYITAMVAIIADSPAADTLLQDAHDVLARFDVPFAGRTIADDRANLSQVIAELEGAGASIFIATNTLAAAIAALTVKPVLAVPLETPDL